MRTAVRAYLVLAITLLTMLLLATKTTGQSEPQNLIHDPNQAATAEPTSDAGDTTDPASYFPALADQIASGAHTAVKSNDGNLTLLIPDGALPANVSTAQIKITSIRANTVPVTVEGSRSLLAYKMEPDGLQFSTPAVAVLTMNPAADETLPLLFSVSGDEVEPITSALYTTDPKNRKLIVTVPINHFSDLLSSQGLFSVLLHNIPDQIHDERFTAEAFSYRQGNSPAKAWTLKGMWTASSNVQPGTVTDAPPITALTEESTTKERRFSVKQNFTCKTLSDYSYVDYTAYINFELTTTDEETNTKQTSQLAQTLSFRQQFACIRMAQALTATFANFTTTYKLTAAHPNKGKLTYTWTNSNSCGDFNATADTSQAKWIHPHTGEAGSCPEEGTDHPGTITVEIKSDRGATETITYKDGSAVGFCKFNAADSDVTGSCTATP